MTVSNDMRGNDSVMLACVCTSSVIETVMRILCVFNFPHLDNLGIVVNNYVMCYINHFPMYLAIFTISSSKRVNIL